jgi:hypothetical protein
VFEVPEARRQHAAQFWGGLNFVVLGRGRRFISRSKGFAVKFIRRPPFLPRPHPTGGGRHIHRRHDILPMLSEYLFDDANKLQRWENILQGVFQ